MSQNNVVIKQEIADAILRILNTVAARGAFQINEYPVIHTVTQEVVGALDKLKASEAASDTLPETVTATSADA